MVARISTKDKTIDIVLKLENTSDYVRGNIYHVF